VTIGDTSFVVARGPGQSIVVDETGMTVEPVGVRAWLVKSRDEAVLAHAVVDGETVWIHAGGRTFVAHVASNGSTRTHRRSAGEQALTAPMPAAVRAVLVEPGQHVEAGDLLVMLEAMKMELPIRAPRAGTVRTIACRAGDLVQPGPALVELS
jgi:biotin carboxyl carrier protein